MILQGERQDEATDDIDLFLFPHVLECLQSGYTREEIHAVFDEYGRCRDLKDTLLYHHVKFLSGGIAASYSP